MTKGTTHQSIEGPKTHWVLGGHVVPKRIQNVPGMIAFCDTARVDLLLVL